MSVNVSTKMPKSEKVKLNVKERVEDAVCDLSLSELNEVPVREIASFKRVTQLDLSSNRLVTLGKNFTTLTRLVKLDLSKNQIRFLPEDFGQLENLRHLDLYHNRLEHLPLSFGKLKRLRYLDLKGNPLAPGWEKIVGHCLTTKDCQIAAKKTVNICTELLELAEKEKLSIMPQQTADAGAGGDAASTAANAMQQGGSNNNNSSSGNSKKSNKKQKNKQKKNNANVNDNELTIKEVNVPQKAQNVASGNVSAANSKNNVKRKSTNGQQKKRLYNTRTAFTSIMTFLLLLAINIVIIYMIMFKNPEIADKLVEYIPPQYRNWILTKTEIFRLRVSDWISEFRTPPEEH